MTENLLAQISAHKNVLWAIVFLVIIAVALILLARKGNTKEAA